MILALLIFPLLAHSKIIQDDVSTLEKKYFSFKEVCVAMVTHETPLIEIVSANELDCMGKKVSVGEFCNKELITDPYYLRGYIHSKKKQVVCQTGKKSFFKFECKGKDPLSLCTKKAEVSCQQVKEKLAKRLDISHSSFSQSEKGIKVLRCGFESLPLSEKNRILKTDV